MSNIFEDIEGLVDPEFLKDFEREMNEKVIPELLGKRRKQTWWYCGNCRSYHSPDTTCPEPSRNDSLRGRLQRAGNRFDA